jgi:hypothetical protein
MRDFFKKLSCKFNGHDWQNDNGWPVHGYKHIPYNDSYCGNCDITGAQYNGVKV